MGKIAYNDNRRYGVNSLLWRAALISIFAMTILSIGLFGSKLLALQITGAFSTSDTMDYFPTRYHSSNCSTCHLKEDDKTIPQLKSSASKLCLTCHFEEQAQMTDSFVHPLFASGQCLGCHKIHTPLHEHLLKEDPQTLCVSCHIKERRAIIEDAHRLLNDNSASCLKCHSNHSSGNVSLLRKDPVALCLGCHYLGESIQNHPVGDNYIDPKKGGILTCTSSCHEPHGSEYESMLQQENNDNLCLNCHNMDIL